MTATKPHPAQTQTTASRLEAAERRAAALTRQLAELKANEEGYRLLFQNNPNPMLVYDLENLKILAVNQTAIRKYGYSREEFLALTIKDIRPPEDIPRLLENVSKVGEGLDEAGCWRHLTKNGTLLDVEIASHTLTFEGRRAELVVATDITERKWMEEILVLGEKRYRAVSELMSDFAYSFRVGPDGALTYEWVAGALATLTGFSREELQARGGWETLLHPEDLPIARRQSDEVMAGRSHRVEYRIITKSGDTRWVEDHARPVWDEDRRQITHVYGAARDIDARKRAEMALKESHASLVTILDSIDATIYVANFEDHRILFTNQEMKKDFGGDCEGRKCFEVFRNDAQPCGHCTNPKLMDAEGLPTGLHVWEGQNPVTGKWYINYDRAIRWLDGRWVRLQIATDITKLKELEAQRQKTDALLRQSQKMEAIGTLAGGIAHDFNNILAAILGFTELSLMDVAEGDAVKSNLLEIFKAGHRAKDMVRQILAFSRQREPERKPIRAGAVVEDTLKWLKSVMPSNIRVETRIEHSGGIIEADSTQIQQVLMNLCTNALHAMRRKGDLLEVTLDNLRFDPGDSLPHPDLAPGAYVRLSVRDNGHGIKPEEMPRIFDPFFTTKNKSEGTGLGLSVVAGIVKSHGGAVTAASAPGQETVFSMFLPAVDRKPAAAAGPAPRPPGGRECILLVDDEPAIAEIGRRLLERLGYAVETRTSSVEAIELFKAKPDRFDLVISDMTMPNLTGDRLALELMAIRPRLPVIICTGYSEKMTEARAREMGIRAFVMKPLLLDALAETVRSVLDEAQAGSA